ncbi:MAG: [citrate (pro-3S)-lyase] ligase [Blautia sp.]
MDSFNLYMEEGFPFTGRKQKRLETFLTSRGLTYDPQITYSIILCDKNGTILGCGSRHENILKCIAIDERCEGEGLLWQIVTQLIKQAVEKGFSHLFLFTKPEYKIVFFDMGFYPVAQTDSMLLLENRKNGICDYLEKERQNTLAEHPDWNPDVPSGAIVMNANPFTKGHAHLIASAAAACPFLHVFVLSEDASEFPADVRLRLVQEGCADFPNVMVHGSSDYLISHATFPDYFLKDKATVNDKTAELDLKIFGKYFKNAFHIQWRFVGEEPFSPVTKSYNEQMKKLLPSFGIQVTEIPRKSENDTVISATLVRKLFLTGNLDTLIPLVPETTFRYLISGEGQALRQKLLNNL